MSLAAITVEPLAIPAAYVQYTLKAGDIATALELAGEHAFDLLLSDLGLPDGSGHDLMRQLRERGHKFPGIALSVATARMLATLLPGVRPTEAWGYAFAALAIALVTLVAAIAPAWRAARIDPAVALRGE